MRRRVDLRLDFPKDLRQTNALYIDPEVLQSGFGLSCLFGCGEFLGRE